jgi:hypothetical protein
LGACNGSVREPRVSVLATPGLFAQRPGGGGADLTVSVSVTPICTVAVRPGESVDHAVDVHCRNLGSMQPEPLVTDDASAVRSQVSSSDDGEVPSADAVRLIVINF